MTGCRKITSIARNKDKKTKEQGWEKLTLYLLALRFPVPAECYTNLCHATNTWKVTLNGTMQHEEGFEIVIAIFNLGLILIFYVNKYHMKC